MANLGGFSINWNEVEELSFEPLEAGEYAAKVTKSEIKNTKKGDGQYLSLTFDVLGSRGRKRKIFPMFMLKHSNPKAVQVGLGKIKSLATQLGIDFDQLQDTSELHGKPVSIKVKIEKSEEYGDKNVITSYGEYDESLLDAEVGGDSDIQVESVEDTIVEDNEVSPAEIQAMKKADLMNFITERGLTVKPTTGSKLQDFKDEVVNQLFATEVVDDNEDFIIDDE